MSKPRAVRTPGDSPDPAADESAAVDAETTTDEAPAPAPSGKRLPHPSTVDPKKITSPVLTSQGWICPAPKA